VTQAGDIYNSTSTSSVAIGTGSKSFTTADSDKPYQAGTPLRIADAAAPETNFMDCIVTSYSGTSLVVESIGFGGSGTKSSWTINIGGAKTVDGTLAINQGGTGATTASDARDNLGLGSIATQDADSVNLDGGNIDGTTIGGSTPAAGSFTTITGSGDMNIDSDTLFVDASEDRVGIGTDSPDGKMHLFTASAGTVTAAAGADELVLENSSTVGMTFLCPNTSAANIIFGDPDDNNIGGIQYGHATDYMSFTTNASEAMLIDSSGRVGIAEINPDNGLFNTCKP
jgi:hypothetical protein